MIISNFHIKHLNEALEKILKQEASGTIAFLRCLPDDIIGQFDNNLQISIPDWDVYIVSNCDKPARKIISADRAVELRELKEERILFIVKRDAGAGMDGIYSSSREIGETELFKEANRIACNSITKKYREFAKTAVKESKKLGIRNTLSPLREFDFNTNCAAEPSRIGFFVTLLGLWPIEISSGLKENDLNISSLLVNKLLPRIASNISIAGRVASLLLPACLSAEGIELEKFIRENDRESRLDTLAKLKDHCNLWLNNITPGFIGKNLQKIEIMPWRKDKKGKPYSWSGMGKEGENLCFSIGLDEKDKSKLQIKWKSLPEKLEAGTVEYSVSIITGSDNELVQKTVTHRNKSNESCIFTSEDFEDLINQDSEGKWEATIKICDSGNPEVYAETESFLLIFGKVAKDDEKKSSAGKQTRTFSEELIKLSKDEFKEACYKNCEADKKGYVKIQGENARVFRPDLIKKVEEDWSDRQYAIGRWMVRVREDGSISSNLEFMPLEQNFIADDNTSKKLTEAVKNLGKKASLKCGFMGMVYTEDDAAVNNYVNAWVTAIEEKSSLALANTIEIRTQSNKTVGLIVLPFHPVRVAWHQAYDCLVFHSGYEEKLSHQKVKQTLSSIDGSFMPSFLPGTDDKSSFVFGDTLGFHAVCMISDTEREPQSAIALMARTLSPDTCDIAPSVSISTASSIAKELYRYSKIHDCYRLLSLNALRPGDSITVAKAMQEFNKQLDKSNNGQNDDSSDSTPEGIGFKLNLYPDEKNGKSLLLGRYFTELTEKRRGGVTSGSDNSWIAGTFRKNNTDLPKLRWSKKNGSDNIEPAHLTIAFDTFNSKLITLPESSFQESRPFETFGLFPSLLRKFKFNEADADWEFTVAPKMEGDKHPASRGLTERLVKAHSAVLKATAFNLTKERNNWPILKTVVDAEKTDSIKKLHELSDWVITVDRNAGLEFFDDPQKNPGIYDTYVIDCVPERQDLNIVQLVTSTIQVDEVIRLLDKALIDMNLSCSEKNCRYLLPKLKAISGRLAMRLSNQTQNAGELIALALFYSACENADSDSKWLPVRKGFFVPLDDVRELLKLEESVKKNSVENSENDNDETKSDNTRADLVYVSLNSGKLCFTFVEIKYRRLLKVAKDNGLFEYIKIQTENTQKCWKNIYFDEKLTPTQISVRRKKLARTLTFYLEKAHRHVLDEKTYLQFLNSIDKLYQSSKVQIGKVENRGYVFCPEYYSDMEEMYSDDIAKVFLFGSKSEESKDEQSVVIVCEDSVLQENGTPSFEEITTKNSQEDIKPDEAEPEPKKITKADPPGTLIIEPKVLSKEPFPITLGSGVVKGQPINWNLSIRDNPHLMIVGLPGMGKTTCINNICVQLCNNGVVPIVFSYHDDIETKLAEALGELSFADTEMGIGFNPLTVTGKTPFAWIDQIGMLRDIFSSIYSDFGDIQNNEIREAIKESYSEAGFGKDGVNMQTLKPPKFQRFFDILLQKPKPNPGVIARLNELNDYGFFRETAEKSSLLESKKPVIIRLYHNQNDVLQNALASFILLNLYQNMFIRGEQKKLSHAIIFDEAHRASRLKLLPTMAKECRKYGVSLIVASQAARDFDPSLFSAIANYLVLRVTESDAKTLAKSVTNSHNTSRIIDQMKQLRKYSAMFFTGGITHNTINLNQIEDMI